MALYVPAGARRRRLVLVAVVALAVGLAVGYVAGRASSPGLADDVAEVQDLAADAATALQRIPIEYEQAVVDEGGESTDTIRSALESAELQLDDAYAEAIWLTDGTRDITDPAFGALQRLVEDRVEASDFEDAVGVLVEQIERIFGITAEAAG